MDGLAFSHFGYNRSRDDLNRSPYGWHKIVHRAVKPVNVFFRDNSLVPGDFGEATIPSSGKLGLLSRKIRPKMKTSPDDRISIPTNYICTTRWLGPEFPVATANGDVWALVAII